MSVPPLNRLQIAWRAAQDITDGMLVNLGLGMPLFVADYLRPEVDVFIQSENGEIGVGALAPPDRADTDLVDAGSRRITVRPGAALVNSAWSFAHNSRRPHRRGDLGRLRGCCQWRSGQLGNAAAEQRASGRRRHGPCRMRPLGLDHHGARDAPGHAAVARHLYVAAHRRALRPGASIPISPSSTSPLRAWWCGRCSAISAKRTCGRARARR